MKHKLLYIIIICCGVLAGCSSNEEQIVNETVKGKKTSRFTGNYNRAFNDLHDLHTSAALKNGIKPLKSRAEAENKGDKLILIPEELAYYKTDKLTHSVPYLVPKAAKLMADISKNFNDSLVSRGLTPYKIILTSLTRTDEDIKKLTKRNMNASHSSVHCYGTTFDISWKRFQKVNPFDKDVSEDKLKLILGQVLFDMKQDERCYIKHEKKQACFHITVR